MTRAARRYEKAVAIRNRVTEAYIALVPLRGSDHDQPQRRLRLFRSMGRLEVICHRRFIACAHEIMLPRYDAARAAEEQT